MAKKKKVTATSGTNVRLLKQTVSDLHILKAHDDKYSLDRVVQDLIRFKYPNGLPK